MALLRFVEHGENSCLPSTVISIQTGASGYERESSGQNFHRQLRDGYPPCSTNKFSNFCCTEALAAGNTFQWSASYAVGPTDRPELSGRVNTAKPLVTVRSSDPAIGGPSKIQHAEREADSGFVGKKNTSNNCRRPGASSPPHAHTIRYTRDPVLRRLWFIPSRCLAGNPNGH